MSEQQVKDAVQQNMDQDNVRTRKRRIGKKDLIAPPSPAQEQAPVPLLQPSLYIVFFYETVEGDTGFSNVVLSNIMDVRTAADMVAVVSRIRQDNPEYKDVQLVNWKTLEA